MFGKIRVFYFIGILIVLSSCSIFKKNNMYGCPSGGAAIGAERILAGEKGALKKSQQSKFKVKNTIN
jgi:hypothetical protein